VTTGDHRPGSLHDRPDHGSAAASCSACLPSLLHGVGDGGERLVLSELAQARWHGGRGHETAAAAAERWTAIRMQ
jgi:hypothetical protein